MGNFLSSLSFYDQLYFLQNLKSVLFYIQVKKDAVKTRGGDFNDRTELLSEYKMQFGGFRGLVDSMRNETAMSSALSHNKHAFKEYAQLFRECREVIAKKREERLKKSKQQNATATPTSTPIQSSGGHATLVAGVCRNVGSASSHCHCCSCSRATPSECQSTPNISCNIQELVSNQAEQCVDYSSFKHYNSSQTTNPS